MGQALSARQDNAISQEKPDMALLPGLCCQAAGGEASWADHIAASWMLFYAAADIMDNLEDQDAPAKWWQDLGPAAALSAATGLFFSAASVIHQTSDQLATKDAAQILYQDFYQHFLIMSSGQYEDLRNPTPSLEKYWRIASEKSGAFFSIACRSGARLATNDTARIDHFGEYGLHFGMILQVLDDLEDLQFITQGYNPLPPDKTTRSLPVVYAAQMVDPKTKEKLLHCLSRASNEAESAQEAANIIEKSGAVLYLLSELAIHKEQAAKGLIQADAQSPAREFLMDYLERLGKLP